MVNPNFKKEAGKKRYSHQLAKRAAKYKKNDEMTKEVRKVLGSADQGLIVMVRN